FLSTSPAPTALYTLSLHDALPICMLEVTGVDLRLNTPATVANLLAGGYDEVVVATGVRPRVPDIPGIDHPKVLTYAELVREEKPDRKSTRLNSSHVKISYAVFCLK